MKYCPKCGTPNETEGKFCINCGNSFPVVKAENTTPVQPAATVVPPAAPITPPPVQQNQNSYTKQGYNYQQSSNKQPNYANYPSYSSYIVPKKPLSTNPTINAIKTALSSGIMIAMAIIYSFGLLINAIKSINAFGSEKAMGDVSEYFNMLGLEQYEGLFDALNIGAIVNAVENYARILNITTLISLIPSILFCIGLWLVFVHARKRDTDTMQQSGLKLLMVTTVLTGLTTIISTILIIPSFITANAGDYIVSVMTATVIISIAIVITYILMILRFIYSVLTTIKKGVPSLKGAMFVAVVSFIVGASSLFSLELLSSAFSILLGFVVLQCRSKLNKLGATPQVQEVSQYTYSDAYQKQLDAYNQSQQQYVYQPKDTDNSIEQ